jgi:hypothetical protein
MEANDQLHAPGALLSGKKPKVPTRYEAGRTPEPALTFWRGEKFPASDGKRTPPVKPTAIPTELHNEVK